MSVDLGVAEGHIVLDTSGFISSLKTAQQSLGAFSSDVALKIGGAFSALGSTIQSFGNALNTAISKPLQGFAQSALSEIVDFENGMNRAGALSKATAEELQQLTEKAKEMGRTTKFSATEASEALQYMALAGWKPHQMMEGLEGIMNLAAASGEDLATVSDIVTDALTAMGLQASDSAHFADVLTAATLNSNTTVGMLGEAFKYAAPVAGALKYRIEDLSLALGLMANAGIKGAQAGTSLRTSLTRMSIAPGMVAEEMEKMGLSMYNADRSAKPLTQLMIEIRQKFRGLDEQTKITSEGIIFGGRAMTAWGAVIEATNDDFNRLLTTLENSEGIAQKTAMRMLESMAGRLDLLRSAISAFKLQFTEDIEPIFSAIANALIDVFNKFSKLEAGTRKVVLALIAFGAAIGPLVVGFGGLLATIGGAIASLGLLAVSFEAIAGLSVAAVATFAGWGAAIVAAIAAASSAAIAFAAAFADLIANNKEFQTSVTSAVSTVKNSFAEVKTEFINLLDSIGASNLEFVDGLKIAWTFIKNAIAPLLLWIIENVKNVFTFLSTYVTGFLNVFNGFLDLFRGNFKEGLTKIFSGIQKMVSSFFETLGQTIILDIKTFVDVITSWGKSTNQAAEVITAANSKTSDSFTELAKNHAIMKKKIEKGEIEETKITGAEIAKRQELRAAAFEKMGIDLTYENEAVNEELRKQDESLLGTMDTKMKQLPGIIGKQRVPMTVEVNKMQTDLVSAGDSAAAGFVGVIDANLSQLEGTFNDYLSDALDVVDDFTASLSDSGTSSAAAFSGALATELKKLPGAFSTQLTAALNTVKTWSTNMSGEAKTMATTFNKNAAETAADLTAQLNTKLTASLNVAGTWVQKMGAKGKDGAKLFLDYMLAAVDEQGKEIEKFGRDIAEHLTIGIEGHSEWIKKRLKKAYLKIIDDMEVDLGITSKATGTSAASAANVVYASDYSLGYSAGSGAVAQRASVGTVQTAAAMPSTIIFNSPVAIDEIEASRLLRKTQQDMLLGF